MQKFLLPQYLEVKSCLNFLKMIGLRTDTCATKVDHFWKIQTTHYTHTPWLSKKGNAMQVFWMHSFSKSRKKKLTLGKILLQSPPSALMVAVLCSFYVKYDSKIIISAQWKIKNIIEYAPAVTLIYRNNYIPQSWISSDTHYFICCGSAFNSSFLKPFQ